MVPGTAIRSMVLLFLFVQWWFQPLLANTEKDINNQLCGRFPCNNLFGMIDAFEDHKNGQLQSNGSGHWWNEVQLKECCGFRVIRLVNADDGYLIGLTVLTDNRQPGAADEHKFKQNEITSKSKFPLKEQLTINSISKLYNLLSTKTRLYLVARVEASQSSSRQIKFSVKVNKRDMPLTIPSNGKIAESVVFGPFQPETTSSVMNVAISSELAANNRRIDYSFNHSYLMFCIPRSENDFENKLQCRPVITAHYSTDADLEYQINSYKFVRCLCSASESITLKHIPLLVLLCFIWLFNFVVATWKRAKLRANNEPEIQVMLILCSVKTAKFQYDVTFRVGCPSPNFNMITNTIDIELLSTSNELIGQPIRFSCNRLLDPICSEMRCLIGKLMPLGPIEALRCYHSGMLPEESIYFFDVSVRDLISNDLLYEYEINRHISNTPTVFYCKAPAPESPQATETEFKSKINSKINSTDSVRSEIPEMPTPELNGLEYCIIFHFCCLYAGSWSMLIYLMYIPGWSFLIPWFMFPLDNLIGTFLLSLISTTVTVVLVCCLIYLYRYIFKRYYYHQKHTPGAMLNFYGTLFYGCLLASIVGSLCFSFHMLTKSNQLTYRQFNFWWSGYMIQLALLVSGWNFISPIR